MKNYGDLFLRIDAQHSPEFFAALDENLPAGWSRAKDAEERAKSGLDREFYYYLRASAEGRVGAMVAIYRRDAETLYVSNVVPSDSGRLEHDEYNAILREFCEQALQRVETKFPTAFVLAGEDLDLGRLMSTAAFAKLQTFSAAANKSTGSAHPLDLDRWFDFLVELHTGKHRLDTASLGRWLTEVEGWSEEQAADLRQEFAFALGLLRYADQKKQGG